MELGIALRNVLLGATLLGEVVVLVVSIALLLLKIQQVVTHAQAAHPGFCIDLLITGGKHPIPMLIGAMVAGVIGSLFMVAVVRGSRIKQDAAIGIVLSVFFGGGIVLLTVIQKLPGGNKSGLDKFLFGQAATLMPEDIRTMTILAVLVLLVVMLFYKELKLLSFDPGFGQTLGLPMRAIEILLTTLLVVVVVVGLQMVGVVLMVAALVTPAAAARQWTDRLGWMLAAAAAFGAASGATGAVGSALVPGLPTGPAIVVAASTVLALSLLFAPERGMIWAWLRAARLAARIRREHVLKDLYGLGERRGEWDTPVPLEALLERRAQGGGAALRCVRRLTRGGQLERSEGGYRLSAAGRQVAEAVVRKHRLWELYLTRRLELAEDHVHRDAEDMEHVLSDDAVAELDELLGHPERDPHGRRIPGRSAA